MGRAIKIRSPRIAGAKVHSPQARYTAVPKISIKIPPQASFSYRYGLPRTSPKITPRTFGTTPTQGLTGQARLFGKPGNMIPEKGTTPVSSAVREMVAGGFGAPMIVGAVFMGLINFPSKNHTIQRGVETSPDLLHSTLKGVYKFFRPLVEPIYQYWMNRPVGFLLMAIPPKRGTGKGPFKEITGNVPRISDKKLARTLKRHQGNQSAAARELGYSLSGIHSRIQRASPNSPIAPFKEIRFKGGSEPKFSDKELARALKRHQGNQSAAARELGIDRSTFGYRIKTASSNSPLTPFKEITGKVPKVSDKELARVLKRHQGNRTAVAEKLGYAISSIQIRIRTATSNSPIAPFKEIKDKVGSKPRFSEKELVRTLKRHQGDRRAAAEELGYSLSGISSRIQRAPSDSPLAPFKEIKGKRGSRPRFSDKELAQALKRNQGNQSGTARELGHSFSAINSRIQRASPDSPLAPFKEIKGKGGSEPKFSDKELARVLKRHQGNQSAAARELGNDRSTFGYRIKIAASDSPLAKFKKVNGLEGSKPKASTKK